MRLDCGVTTKRSDVSVRQARSVNRSRCTDATTRTLAPPSGSGQRTTTAADATVDATGNRQAIAGPECTAVDASHPADEVRGAAAEDERNVERRFDRERRARATAAHPEAKPRAGPHDECRVASARPHRRRSTRTRAGHGRANTSPSAWRSGPINVISSAAAIRIVSEDLIGAVGARTDPSARPPARPAPESRGGRGPGRWSACPA